MAYEKRGKKRAASLEIKSSPFSNSEATHDALLVATQRKRKALALKVPKRARGHGNFNPQESSSQGPRPRMKRASTPGTHMEGDGDALESLERVII